MPNWVDNHLTILVPRPRIEAFKAAISGPEMWPFPMVDANGGGLGRKAMNDLSNHIRLDVEGRAEEHIAEFRDSEIGRARPDWMPVSRMDVIAMKIGKAEGSASGPNLVPLSIPAVAPWEDRAEFDRYFPGIEDGAYWNIDPAFQQAYDRGNLGSIALCNARISTKWPLIDVRLVEEDARGDELVDLHFHYLSPWSPADIVAPMEKVLKEHGAKMFALWFEEDCHSGYFYADPGTGRKDSDDFGQDYAVEDEDEDGDIMRGINREAVADRALASIEDDDFTAPIF